MASHCGVWQHSRERIYAFPTRDFGRPRKRDFAGLNLHLGFFDQPEKNEFFNRVHTINVQFPEILLAIFREGNKERGDPSMRERNKWDVVEIEHSKKKRGQDGNL